MQGPGRVAARLQFAVHPKPHRPGCFTSIRATEGITPASATDAVRERFQIRPATEADLPFVFASWLRSYQSTSDFARRIPRNVYFDRHHAVIERILHRGATVTVAHPIGDPTTILGWLVREGTILHYCFVKPNFRRWGIATALLADVDVAACTFTHWTRVRHDFRTGSRVNADGRTDDLLRKWPNASYDPYAI